MAASSQPDRLGTFAPKSEFAPPISAMRSSRDAPRRKDGGGLRRGAGAVRRRSRSSGRRSCSAARAQRHGQDHDRARHFRTSATEEGAHILRGQRPHQRAALRQGAARARPRSGRATGIPDAHGGGESGRDGGGPLRLAQMDAAENLCAVSASRRATIAFRRPALGRRTADAGDRARADDQSEAAGVRRSHGRARPTDPRRDLGLSRGTESERRIDPRHRQEHRRAPAHRRSSRGARKGTRRMARHERGIQGESRDRRSPSPCRRRRARAAARRKDGNMILTPGITKAGEGLDNIAWNILGQTYVPKQVSERSFAWHATFPPDTFVPPHIHPTQDEFIYMFEGQFELMLDGRGAQANPGDLVRLPMGLPHGIFNKSGRIVKCLFWVTPTRRLYDLFWGIHNMAEQTPAEVVALSAKHEVDFLPPPEEGT